MATSGDYLEFLKELLQWLPQRRVRCMLGGAGFYSDELFFAIADDGSFYLKAVMQGSSSTITVVASGSARHRRARSAG